MLSIRHSKNTLLVEAVMTPILELALVDMERHRHLLVEDMELHQLVVELVDMERHRQVAVAMLRIRTRREFLRMRTLVCPRVTMFKVEAL